MKLPDGSDTADRLKAARIYATFHGLPDTMDAIYRLQKEDPAIWRNEEAMRAHLFEQQIIEGILRVEACNPEQRGDT